MLGAARCSRGQVTCLCQPSTPRKRRRCWPGTALTALTSVWNTSALARFATPSATTRAASPASWPASPSWRIPWRTGVTGGRRRSCCTPLTWRSRPVFAEVESTAVVLTAPAVKVRETVTLTETVLELQSVARTTAPRTRSFSTDRKIIHNSYSHRNVSRISRKDFSWFNTFVTHQRMIFTLIPTRLLSQFLLDYYHNSYLIIIILPPIGINGKSEDQFEMRCWQSGGRWDASDDCCERRCHPARPCREGQGHCQSDQAT